MFSWQIQKSKPIWISSVRPTSSVFTTNRERETEDYGKSNIRERLQDTWQARPGQQVKEWKAASSVLCLWDGSEAARGQREEARHQQQD